MKPKTKRLFKRIGMILLIAILGGLIASFALTVADGFERELNPDNLMPAEYLIEDGDTNGVGIDISVNDDGVIKLNGKATSDDEYSVCFITLKPGTYTISGIKSNLDGVALKVLYNGNMSAVSGLMDDTFVIETETTVEVVITVAEGTWCINKTIKPVIVEGEKPGDFYA